MAGAVDLGSVFARLEMQTKQFESGINKSTKKLEGFSKKVGKIMKTVGKAIVKGMAVGGVALAGAGIASAKMAADFEKSMTNVRTLIDDGVENFGEMKNAVLELSKRVPVAIGDLSSALYDVRSAGISAEDAMKVLESSAILATAGLGTTQEATNLLTSAINVYGDETHDSTKLADILFKTVKAGKTTIAGLSQGFGKVAAIAKETGISIEDLSASTAILTTGGITASEAQTALKAAIANILKPTKDAEDAAKKLGIKFDLGALQAKGLSGMLKEVATNAGDDKQALADLFGSVEAANAIFALASEDGLKKFDEIAKDMKSDVNELDKAFGKQIATTSAQYEMFKNNLNVVMIKLGDKILPIVNEAMAVLLEKGGELKDKVVALKDKIIEIKDKIFDWVSATKKSIEENETLQVVIDTLKEAGTKLWNVLGDLKDEWDELQKTLEPIMPDLKWLAKIIGVLLLGAILGVIGVLIIIITAFKNTIKIIRTAIEWFKKIWHAIQVGIGNVIIWFKELPDKIWDAIKGVGDYFSEAFSKAGIFAENAVNDIIDWFKDLPNKIWEAIKGVGSYIIKAFKNINIPMPHFSLGTQYKKFLGASIPMPKFNIDWYQKGTPFVPKTGLYGLHKGEAVIPASQNKLSGVGGIVVNINGGNYFGSKEEVGDMIAKIIGKRFDFNNRF